MDLLHNAYSTASDDDDEVEEKPETKHQILPLPSSKRPKPDNPYSSITTSTSLKPHYYMPPRPSPSPSPNPNPNLQTEAPVPGRYVSKRERALFGSSPRVSDPNPNPSSTPTSSSASVFGSISDSSIPHDIMSSLRHQREDRAWLGRISERLTIALRGHSKAVNAIHWSPSHVLVYSPSSCFRWDGSHNLYMECMEQRSEESACVKLPQCSSKRCEVVATRIIRAFLWIRLLIKVS